MRVTARLAERLDLVVQLLPLAAQDVFTRDDDIDLARAGLDRGVDLLDALLERAESGGKAGADGRDRNVRALQRGDRVRHALVIDAHRADRNARIRHAERFEDVLADGAARLRAQTLHVRWRVVTAEGGEVDAGDRLEEPCRLCISLDTAAGG